MDDVEGSRMFANTGSSYDLFMGRYSAPLAQQFIDVAGVEAGDSCVDVGCGPGALTGVLVDRLGADSVAACDPSAGFVADCRERHPGVRVEIGQAEVIPFETNSVDHALAQLVFHFVSEPDRAVAEMRRVVRPGGHVSACVWDFDDGMEMLIGFWDVALDLDPTAPDEARSLRFGRPGEIADLFESAGMEAVEESSLHVSSTYADFDELWNGFLAGVGPAGAYCVSLPNDHQVRLRDALYGRFGSPSGSFTLGAVARSATCQVM